MKLTRIMNLKEQIQNTDNLNLLRDELLKEFDWIIHVVKELLEKDVKNLEQDVQELRKTTIGDKKTLEIIGHLVMDFSVLRQDLETEI